MGHFRLQAESPLLTGYPSVGPLPVVEARRILFVRTDRLGETLLNLPAMAALKRGLPEASLTLLAHPELATLMARMPVVDEVIPSPPAAATRWWVRAHRLGRQLRAHRFDLAVVSNPKKEFHLAVWLAGIPCRVGYGRKWGCLLTHRLHDEKALGERHEVEYNLDLVRALGLPAQIIECSAPQLEVERREILQLLYQQGVKASELLVAIHPWTSNPLKQWPVDRFAALIRVIVAHVPVRVTLIGAPDVREQVPAVMPQGLPIIDLVGRLTLVQLAALLAHARCLVSNDSGPVHLAAAVGTRTVVLFGTPHPATGPGRWGPWGEGHTVVWKRSMEDITVDEVVAALQRQLTHA